MKYRLLYVLMIRCTEQTCKEDLSCYPISAIDENTIYTAVHEYPLDSIMDLEVIKKSNEEIILRVPFFVKEAAILLLREAFLFIREKSHNRKMEEAAKREWVNIGNVDYDPFWCTGGKNVEEWKKELKKETDELIGKLGS